MYFAADDFQRNVSNNNIVYLNKTTINNNILGKIYRSPESGIYFLNTKSFSYLKLRKKGRIKRKIQRRLLKLNPIID